jgi:hypothetical protein
MMYGRADQELDLEQMERLADAADAYVAALVRITADPRPPAEAHLWLDVTLHDLVLATGRDCIMCEPDSCPGIVGGALTGIVVFHAPVVDTEPL